jgi:hypothetical protein
MGKKWNACKVLVGKPGKNRPLGRRKDNIKMDLRGIGQKGMDYISLAWKRDS